jgi:hypothetical protein
LDAFRGSSTQVLWHSGANVHESRTHLVRGRPYEDVEPRLYYRRFAHYGLSLGYVETLWSPYLMMFDEYSERVNAPLYLHMKFCKRQRFSNVSVDRQLLEEGLSQQGDELPAGLRDQVKALGL